MVAAGGMLLALLACAFREPLLRGAASWWIVSHPVGKADAIVILGGGPQRRPFAAARLYREGLGAKVLIMRVREQLTDQLRLSESDNDINYRVVRHEGVPMEAVEWVGDGVTSTAEEVAALAQWVRRTGARRLLVPTDQFHTRRTHWLLSKHLREAGTELIILALPHDEFDSTNWWRHEEGVLNFQNEIVKYCYYRLRF